MGAVELRGYLDVPAERWQAVLAALPAHIELTRAEPGCQAFEVTPDPAQPHRLRVFERFCSRAAFEDHQARTGASEWARTTAGIERHYSVREVAHDQTPEVLAALDGAALFSTPRLRCRHWRRGDLDALMEVYADPVGARWVGDGEPISRSEAERWLTVTARNYESLGYGMFALEAFDQDQAVGFCGLVHPGGQTEAEAKYALRRSLWGRGLASELLPALLEHGRSAHGLTQVIATVAAQNLASQRVLFKAGMRFRSAQLEADGAATLLYSWTAPSA